MASGTECNFTEFVLETRLHFVNFRGSPASFDAHYTFSLSSFYMDRNMLSWIHSSFAWNIKGASLSLPWRKAIDKLLGKFKPEVQQWFLTSFSTMNVEQDEGIADRQIEQKPENMSVPLS